MTIKDLCDKFANQNNKPLPEDDVEIIKIYVTDYHEDIKKLTGKEFKYLESVLFWIDMLKYDDGQGMATAYQSAVKSMGAFAMWCKEA
jgi:hypothetical protein